MNLEIDPKSGVPFYRQIIEQIRFAIASGELAPGDQLPTVRQLAVDLEINPNTVVRAYREMETLGVLDTQQGSGTYVGARSPRVGAAERRRVLDRIATEMLARAQRYGITLDEVLAALEKRQKELKS